jgi:uncharacterized protein (TIGR04551 family)
MNNSLIFRSLLTALLVCAGASVATAQNEPTSQEQAAPDEAPDADAPAEETAPEADVDSDPEADDADADEQDDETPEADSIEPVEPAEPADASEPVPPATADPEEPFDRPAEIVEDPPPAVTPPEVPLEQDEEAVDVADDPIDAPPVKESPIADLAEETGGLEFVPLEDIEEGVLQSITPAQVYPYIDWSGSFRLRSDLKVNFDLDTRGTSAVPPPVEQFTSSSAQGTEPVDENSDSLWSTNMRLRLEPEINITEALRLHIEADVFDNIVLGTQQAGADYFGVAGIDPDRPMIQVNEAWGEIDAFFGTLRAGRMDDGWGLGIFANDGDCIDCSVETPVDRVSFTTHIWELYGRLTLDFPAEGLTTNPLTFAGQSYDASQTDDVDQYTLSIFRKPMTRKDRELRAHRLFVEKKPVYNGGIYFTYRDQSGFFSSPANTAGANVGELDRLDQGILVYRGMEMYIPDVWFEVLYNPNPDMLLRVSLEAVGIFGSIDNATTSAVGVSDTGDAVNCFNADEFATNEQLCTSQGSGLDRRDVSSSISEFGVALESELYFGGPVRFGLNGGFASGGSDNNWGFETVNGNVVSSGPSAMEFYRFNPNYHVDLILFREVIGTVTNAYYGNPWAQVRFWESPGSRMEVQLDAIFSAAVDPAGTPSAIIEDDVVSGGNSLLGLEFDAAARYIESDHFRAELAGGILFPFAGLEPQINSQRLLPYGDQPVEYGEVFSPSLAWTVQANLNWLF